MSSPISSSFGLIHGFIAIDVGARAFEGAVLTVSSPLSVCRPIYRSGAPTLRLRSAKVD